METDVIYTEWLPTAPATPPAVNSPIFDYCWDSNHWATATHKHCAPPGNQTQVARMGILRDTTTPAAQCRQQTELVLSLAELTDTQIRVD